MRIIKTLVSTDGMSRKYILRTDDGYEVEALYVDHFSKHIICFSTQVGCSIKCKICSAGKFVRNLTHEELVKMCTSIRSEITTSNKPVLFSAMGVGEPTCNWENVVYALNFFNWKDSLNRDINTNKFAISTMVPDMNNYRNMLDLSEKLGLKVKIQISVHSLRDSVRKMIFNDKCYSGYNVKDTGLLATVIFKVEYNYVLIDGINDSVDDANMLADLHCETDILIKINEFHPFNGFNISTRKNVFINVLKKRGVRFEEYSTNGVDISGACGQLVGGLY